MTFSKMLTSALAGVALLALAGPASADQLADIKAAGKIVTSVDMHFTPFGMVVDGKYEGLNKDLFDEVAKELGVEPVYQDIPWPAQLPGMEVKKFDIVTTAAAITPERLERYAFTLPVVYAPVGLIRAAGNNDIRKPEDIKGKVAGAIQGSTQAKKLRAFSDEIGGVDIREYGTIDEAYADLVAGRLDAMRGGRQALRVADLQLVVYPAMLRIPRPGITVLGGDAQLPWTAGRAEVLFPPGVAFDDRHGIRD